MITAAELRAAFDGGFAEPEPGPPPPQRTLLLVTAGGAPYAIALAQVASLHADLPVIAMPSPSRTLIGLATVRNVIVPVHDLASALGAADRAARGRWIAIAQGAPLRGWMFETFEGQLRIDPEAVAARRIIDLEELRHG